MLALAVIGACLAMIVGGLVTVHLVNTGWPQSKLDRKAPPGRIRHPSEPGFELSTLEAMTRAMIRVSTHLARGRHEDPGD